jgi:hypothetical protein
MGRLMDDDVLLVMPTFARSTRLGFAFSSSTSSSSIFFSFLVFVISSSFNWIESCSFVMVVFTSTCGIAETLRWSAVVGRY